MCERPLFPCMVFYPAIIEWSIAARPDLSLYASREVLGETVCVDEIPV